jgi:mRNA interferase HicA
MKRAELIRHLQACGCQLFREGGRHSIWWNPANRKTTAVPRHNEIVEPTARRICKDLGVPKPGENDPS